MAKKTFDTQIVTDKFFTQVAEDKQNTQDTHNTQDKQEVKAGRPKKETPLRGYRYNMLLDADLNEFLHFAAWNHKESMTQYINDLIRSEKEKYLTECERTGQEPFKGWKD